MLARVSNRLKKGVLFACASVAATAIVTAASGWSQALRRGLSPTIVGFASSLYAPFTLTVILDAVSSTRLAMVGRELFLNAGRTLGGVFVLAAYVTSGELQTTLIASA